MSYYSGNRQEAEKILDRTVRIGLDSKMFDCQTLVLLAFTRLENGDHKGLQRCRDDFARLIDRNPKNERLQRLAAIVEVLSSIEQQQFAQAVTALRSLAQTVKSSSFDFEAASNLLALMALLAHKTIQLDEVESVVDTVGLRFCTSSALSELLAGAANVYAPYAQRIHQAHSEILRITEYAVSLSMSGDPQACVKHLIFHGNATLNGKLIDTAHLVLQRYLDKIADAQNLTETVQTLRAHYFASNPRPVLGEKNRQAGGLTLRTSGSTAKTSTPQS
jgi:hypothetical protein